MQPIDIAALLAAVAGPIVVLVALVLYREPLSTFLTELPRRVRSFSVAGVAVELAEARPDPLGELSTGVDMRHAGSATQLGDRAGRPFRDQFQDTTPIDYAVVDLGVGDQWLSSRLYIVAVLFGQMRGLRALAFVDSNGGVRRHYLGACSTEAVRWRLAARWPEYERAFTFAELQMWRHPRDPMAPLGEPPAPSSPAAGTAVPAPTAVPEPTAVPGLGIEVHVQSDQGRLADQLGNSLAGPLLTAFLTAIQRDPWPALPGWVEVEHEQPNARIGEYAEWLTGSLTQDVLRESLDGRSIRLSDYQGWPQEVRVRALVEHGGDWVAFTRDERVFDRLTDRLRFLEQIASKVVS